MKLKILHKVVSIIVLERKSDGIVNLAVEKEHIPIQKSSFRNHSIMKDYFLDHYDEIIIGNGI